MSDPVDLPVAGPNATLLEIFQVIATRIDTVAKVLEAEHKWFGSIIDFTRQIDGGEEDIARELENGWIDEEEAERRRTTDEPHILKVQSDTHQRNVNGAVHILKDASRTLRALITGDEEGAACGS